MIAPMMRDTLLFRQPRLRLALLYSGVIGGILLGIGYIAHHAIDKAFDRVVDREITLLTAVVNTKLTNVLAAPGTFTPRSTQLIPGLCLLAQPCQPTMQDPVLRDLFVDDYHLQLLDLAGNPIAAIAEAPDPAMRNPPLQHFYNTTTANGQTYHVHLSPLKTREATHWGYLQIGRSTRPFDDYMRSLHWLIIFGVPVTMGLIGGASWWLSGIAMRPLYQSYEQMRQFTANAAHELRTPIAAMKAMLEVAPTEDPNDQQQTLRSLQRQTDRLGKLAQDLLLLSRLDGPTAMPHAAISLNDLVQDLEEELAPLALAAQVSLSSQIGSSELSIHGQSEQIYRLVSNLITNAIHYTPPDGTIVIRLDRRQNQAIIAIEDNGNGIAAADLPHLFERFYRVNHDRSRQTGGVGLGLAIAQAIAQAHGGQIQVQSQIDRGSIFTVRLPLKPGV
jgi:signal transduction histidine kinase